MSYLLQLNRKGMLVSVIIPTYKPSGYIYECLESLLEQTLDNGLFEILIVLNGCKEPFLKNITQFIAGKNNKPKIRIIHTDVAGVSNARNIGLLEASGDYIAFVDDDDWVSPNYLNNLVRGLGECDLAISNVLQVEDVTNNRLPHYQTTAYKKCCRLNHLTFFNARSFLSSSWAKLIPRNVIRDDMFIPKYALGEDSLFMFQISKRVDKMFLASSDTIYYVRKRSSSVSHKAYPYSFRVRLALSLSYSYLKIYLSAPFKYNLLFFMTRVAATMRKLFQRGYSV